MKKKKKQSLRKKILRGLLIFAFVLAVVTSVMVCSQSVHNRMRVYTEDAYAYAKVGANMIDGDRVLGYLETGSPDEDYYNFQKYIESMQKELPLLKYYYVFVPYEKDLVYVWDGDVEPGEIGLGYREAYMNEDSEADAKAAMSKNPPEELSIQKSEEYGQIGSAYYPVYNSSGEPVVIVGIDFSMDGVKRALIFYTLLIFITVITITLIAQSIIYRFIESLVIDPITKLTESTADMVENIESDETIKLDIHTGDEIETLADSIEKMEGDLKTYIKELSQITAEKERIVAELDVARQIQEGMLPSTFPAFPDRDEFDLHALMDPALDVGGDFYDFFMVDDDHIALVIADVSGKGIPASLFMMISMTLIKNAVKSGLDPGDALTLVNNQLLESNVASMFVTVWLAVIDIYTGEGLAANAGHEHPALKRTGGDYELVKYPHSPVAAAIENLKFKQHGFRLNPGDKLFVYTDGVPEATNADTVLYGEELMLEALNRYKDANPEDTLRYVKEDIDSFVGEAPQFDDITMLGFEFKGDAK